MQAPPELVLLGAFVYWLIGMSQVVSDVVVYGLGAFAGGIFVAAYHRVARGRRGAAERAGRSPRESR